MQFLNVTTKNTDMEQNTEQLEVKANYEVPVEKLFAAWTDSEQLKQWWKTTGYQLQDVTNDLKPGGTVRYTFENNELEITGEYETVEENKQLVYSWKWVSQKQELSNADYKLSVRFFSEGNGSSIHITQESLQKSEHVHPHKEGWERGLEDLKQFLSGSNNESVNSNNSSNDSGNSNANKENGGYREDPDQVKVGGE